MQYPNHVVQHGDVTPQLVQAVKSQLNHQLGSTTDSSLYLDPTNPHFGPKMVSVVKVFQARNVDSEGHPLRQDGVLGALTWEALFGPESVTTATVPQGADLAEVLRLARTAADKPVREEPRNSNRGPDVETYLRSVGLGPGYAWCAAFVYWCAQQAAKTLGCANPLVQTAGVSGSLEAGTGPGRQANHGGARHRAAGTGRARYGLDDRPWARAGTYGHCGAPRGGADLYD